MLQMTFSLVFGHLTLRIYVSTHRTNTHSMERKMDSLALWFFQLNALSYQ